MLTWFAYAQDLADNEAGPPATYAIAQMMVSNSTLTHLVLRGELTTGDLESDIAFITISFIGNLFNDHSAEPLAEVIKVSTLCSRVSHTILPTL